MAKIPITRRGYRCLLRELAYLRGVVRPRVLEELQDARAFGAKWENQQYLLARERHLVLQRQINELENKLERCEIVVGRKFFFKQAGFGTVILVQNTETGEKQEYQLVGPYESDVKDGKLSIESPVGRSVLGRFEGDEVTVRTPSGMRSYRILAIRL